LNTDFFDVVHKTTLLGSQKFEIQSPANALRPVKKRLNLVEFGVTGKALRATKGPKKKKKTSPLYEEIQRGRETNSESQDRPNKERKTPTKTHNHQQ
jgi:hypothetical protein